MKILEILEKDYYDDTVAMWFCLTHQKYCRIIRHVPNENSRTFHVEVPIDNSVSKHINDECLLLSSRREVYAAILAYRAFSCKCPACRIYRIFSRRKENEN